MRPPTRPPNVVRLPGDAAVRLELDDRVAHRVGQEQRLRPAPHPHRERGAQLQRDRRRVRVVHRARAVEAGMSSGVGESAQRSARAGALMSRSTLTVFPCTGPLSDLQGHHAPAPLLDFDAARDGPNALPAGVGGEHLGRRVGVLALVDVAVRSRTRRNTAALSGPALRVSAKTVSSSGGRQQRSAAGRSACVDRSPRARAAAPRRRTSAAGGGGGCGRRRGRRPATGAARGRCSAAGDGVGHGAGSPAPPSGGGS